MLALNAGIPVHAFSGHMRGELNRVYAQRWGEEGLL
jgi:hypothetical protein